MANVPEEKRKAARIGKSLVVLYCDSHGEDKKKWDMTLVMDVSETGMKITTRKYFPTSINLYFYAKIPFRPFEWIEFTGRVVECKEFKTVYDESVAGMYLTRIEFTDLQAEDKKILREYIEWFLTKREGKK